jgi:hypothetical protein
MVAPAPPHRIRGPGRAWHALPKASSGVDVASRTMPTSAAGTPAMSSAALAALAACSDRLSPLPMTCLRRMPVREAIHSSLVSTQRVRSSFDSTVAGTLLPTPTSRQPVSPGVRC